MKTFVLMVMGHLLPLWGVATNSLETGPSKSVDCEVARAKCAYRTSCARALHSYMVDCADVLAGRTTRCPWACKRALISLTSSDAGYQLSTCSCGNNDFCRKSKERVEVCRPEVTWATADDTVVPCSVAQWICHADPLCSTALGYYHRYCRSLFHGRKCTPRCNNSLAILDRQEKASKLRNCYCDGTEDFPCDSIRKNTQRLCYGKSDWSEPIPVATTTSSPSSGAAARVGQWLLLISLMFLAFPLICHFEPSSVRASVGRPESVSFWAEYDAVSRDNSGSTSGCRRKARKSGLMQWPWWWTSERTK